MVPVGSFSGLKKVPLVGGGVRGWQRSGPCPLGPVWPPDTPEFQTQWRVGGRPPGSHLRGQVEDD